MITLKAQSAEELAVISDSLRDAWLDAEQIQFDPATGEVVIPFERQVIVPTAGSRRTGFLSTVLRRSILCYLRVRNVSEFSVNDTEQVRFYDLSGLKFVRNELRISTGVPIQLTIKVSDLYVELEETDCVIEEREGRRISFDLLSRPSKSFGK